MDDNAALRHPRAMNFAIRYEQAIGWIVSQCPPPDKFAHTYAGLCLWLVSSILLRKPLSSPWPLAAVILAELANECVDRVAHGSWRWPDTIGDVVATLFWPFILMTSLRVFPHLRAASR